MAADPLIGRVFGKIKVERLLGQGGMGRVYLGHHETLDKKVALKVLAGALAADESFVGRFIREARSAAKLEHAHAVQILDAGSEDGVHYIVMQFVEGTDLGSVLKKKGPLPVKDALGVTRRVALALGAAHDQGLVHRDIKPSNIMLGKGGRVFVTDFGLARQMEGGKTLTATDTVVGTPHYMSPEQAEGRPVDARSDIYSLGATLYHFLTGKPPYDGPTPLSILMKHCKPEEKPPSIRAGKPEVPQAVEALVMRMMAKDPIARPTSAKDLVAEIDRITTGDPTVVATRSAAAPPEPPKRFWTRKRMVIGGSALGVVLLLMCLWGGGKAQRALDQARRLEEGAGEDITQLERALERYSDVVRVAPDSDLSRQADEGIQRVEVRIAMADAGRLEANAGDDIAQLERAKVRYEDVTRLSPNSEESRAAEDAAARIGGRVRILRAREDLAHIEAAYLSGAEDFATTLARLAVYWTDWQERIADLPQLAITSQTVMRRRLLDRTRAAFQAISDQDWNAAAALIDPTQVREAGAGMVRFALQAFFGGPNQRRVVVENLEIDEAGVQIDLDNSRAQVPVRWHARNEVTGETNDGGDVTHWMFVENDWYLRMEDRR